MYDLGEQFAMNYSNAMPNPSSIIKDKNNKYRFTLITESLIRIEYSDSGEFEDKPTQLVWFRNHPKPNFQIKEDQKYLELETKFFKLTGPLKAIPTKNWSKGVWWFNKTR